MKEIKRFALLPHAGSYETWGERSQLIFDGKPTSTTVPGHQLLRQYEVPMGYLLATDFNCPYEEQTHFLLLDHRFRVLSDRVLGVPALSVASNGSYLLKDIEWLDDWHFLTIPYGDAGEKWHFTIRRHGIPFLYPQLKMTPVRE